MIKPHQIAIINEEDKCLKCGRKVYKDKIVNSTKEGFVCFKCIKSS